MNLGLRYDIFTPSRKFQTTSLPGIPFLSLYWSPARMASPIRPESRLTITAFSRASVFPTIQVITWYSRRLWHELLPREPASQSPLKNPPFVANKPTCNSPGWGSTTCSAGYTTFADGFPLSTTDTPIAINAPNATVPSAFDPHFRMSYMEQYNLTVQKDWGGNVVSVGYIGMLGRQMMQWLNDLNAPPPNTCATSQCYQALRPYYAKYPGLGTVNFVQSHGVSSYNALEATLKRRLKGGLSVNASYDWSHNLSDVDSYTNGATQAGVYFVPTQIRQIDWGNDNLDIPQRISERHSTKCHSEITRPEPAAS